MKKILFTLFSLILVITGLVFTYAKATALNIDNTPDCDTVAIIKCGSFTEAELKADAAKGEVPIVYGHFGIKQSDLTGFVNGVVWKDGRVTIGNSTVVATSAKTAGNWYHPTSDMKKIPGTIRAYEMSTSHFVDDGQTAFIKMVNGKFAFAIIKPCGNPVVATPVIAAFSCTGLTVTTIGREDFTFKATASIKNATFKYFTYVVKDSKGQVVSSIKSTTLNETVKYHQTVVGTYTVEAVLTVDVFGKLMSAPVGVCKKSFTVAEVPISFICKSLTKEDINRTTFRFTGEAATTGKVDITGYVFKVNGDVKQNTLSKTFTFFENTPGTYTVTLQIQTNKGTTPITALCSKKVTVEKPPTKPTFSCDLLNKTPAAGQVEGQERTFVFTTETTAEGGATVNKYFYDFGDGVKQTATNVTEKGKVEHTYNKDGKFTITVKVEFMVNGNPTKPIEGDKCKTEIEITTPVAPTPPAVQAAVSGKLPNTGPGDVAGVFGATSAVGYIAHRLRTLRRLGRK